MKRCRLGVSQPVLPGVQNPAGLRHPVSVIAYSSFPPIPCLLLLLFIKHAASSMFIRLLLITSMFMQLCDSLRARGQCTVRHPLAFAHLPDSTCICDALLCFHYHLLLTGNGVIDFFNERLKIAITPCRQTGEQDFMKTQSIVITVLF